MNSQSDLESLRRSVKVLNEHRRILLAIWLLCIGAAVAYAWLATPIYRAEALLAPAADDRTGRLSEIAGQLGGLASLAGINLNSGEAEAVAVETLKSRRFLEAFIEQENLLPQLFAKYWDGERKEWRMAAEHAPSALDGAKFFRRKVLNVSVDPDTGFVSLQVEWRDRRSATEWANKLARRLNEEMRRQAIADADTSLKFLNLELAKASEVPVREAIFRLVESQLKNRVMANSREEFVFKIVDPAPVLNEKEFVRPKRIVLAAIGVVGGAMFAALAILGAHAVRGLRPE
jgi:uncharacterized protein involved in exopolysaccharide biosynthesis